MSQSNNETINIPIKDYVHGLSHQIPCWRLEKFARDILDLKLTPSEEIDAVDHLAVEYRKVDRLIKQLRKEYAIPTKTISSSS